MDRQRQRGGWLPVLAGISFVLMAMAPSQAQAPAPEAATGRTFKAIGTARKDMVVAANPLAAQAGREILAEGGSAVDAAIAVQMVLNLVEPQSSGLGGGAFMVVWDGHTVTTFDGRETAPAAAKPDRFLAPDGKPMPFYEAVVGGRSVGVPGVLRLLELAHAKRGRLPWKHLFEPAIHLAEEGFAISPRLNGLLSQEKYLRNDPVAKAYFYDEQGQPKAIGTVLRNLALARTLHTIADEGADAFYSGDIAQDIVATVAHHPTHPGDMTLDDLKAYRARERDPVCGPYRSYTICGMGPPSSGAIAIQQMLSILGTQDMTAMKPGPEAVHWFSEAGRLAFADRNLYVADPAFVSVPIRGLTDPAYLKSRAALIDPNHSMGKAKPGTPPFQKTFLGSPSEGVEHGTSHISIVDRNGMAVAMTTTIEDAFGSRLMTKSGFLLNNQLTDFSFSPWEDGKPVANRVEGGKRPRSSMAPTLVFNAKGKLYAVLGSPGGSNIINYIVKTLVALLDWRLDPQAAADFPNFGSRNGPTELEAGTEAEAWKAGLEAKGHQVEVMDETSGIHVIISTSHGFIGGADSRREGVAIGN